MALPTMSTERLDLRPFTASDSDAFHSIWGDPEVIWWGAAANLEESNRLLTDLTMRISEMPDGMGWAWLRERASGVVVGDVVLQPAPDPPGGIEIGWHLAREFWGHGYATEGAAALIPHAWSLGIQQVIATIVPVNIPSVRVAERLGMSRRGPTIARGGLAHGIWVLDRSNGRPTADR